MDAHSGSPFVKGHLFLDVEGGLEVTVTLTTPGAYLLVVEELLGNGDVVAKRTVAVTCRYVRREIRSLTDADREEFFDTMQLFYGISNTEGKVMYGEDFFSYQKLTAYHNAVVRSVLFCSWWAVAGRALLGLAVDYV